MSFFFLTEKYLNQMKLLLLAVRKNLLRPGLYAALSWLGLENPPRRQRPGPCLEDGTKKHKDNSPSKEGGLPRVAWRNRCDGFPVSEAHSLQNSGLPAHRSQVALPWWPPSPGTPPTPQHLEKTEERGP